MPKQNRIAITIGAALVVLLGVGLFIALLSDNSTSSGKPAGAAETASLLQGIPQSGTALGRPDAPVTLVEYGDLRCPICKNFATGAFHQLVTDYVRPGKLRIVYEPQTFVGAQAAPGDSEHAARFALAAGLQNKFWDVTDLFYANQGDENQTYVTDSFLRQLGSGVTGLDTNRALGDRNSAGITKQLADAGAAFTAAGFQGTPSFRLGRTGHDLTPLPVASLDISNFRAPIDKLLNSQ